MANYHRRGYGGRYQLLDTIRGLTLISMILYHLSWDLVYIAGVNWPWYHTRQAFYWQQSICWTFILLSGFCIPLSVHRYKRGLLVYGAGLLVTAVTLVFLPQDRVIFGVLTFIGSAMLIAAVIYRYAERVPSILGAVICGYLFYCFRWVNDGLLTLWPGKTVGLPEALYHGSAMTYLGFMERGFYSTDYFSILPWIFLFFTGMYLHLLLRDTGAMRLRIWHLNCKPLTWMGQHSLLIYLLHQPAIYLVISLWMMYVR